MEDTLVGKYSDRTQKSPEKEEPRSVLEEILREGARRLLLLDEPSLGLAPLIVRQIFDIIRKINAENGTTIFLVEQNANLALKAAGRGYVMENGRIILTDSSENLLQDEGVKKAYLGV
jgi:branched-chain amino acid transport system ATP-binding protein